jgi:hypothetical protein
MNTQLFSDSRNLARNDQKTAIYHFVSSQVQKNIFAFCVITFEPIEVQTHSAPQNDHLNVSFVKDSYVDGGKLAGNGQKTAILAGGWGQLPIDDEYAASL